MTAFSNQAREDGRALSFPSLSKTTIARRIDVEKLEGRMEGRRSRRRGVDTLSRRMQEAMRSLTPRESAPARAFPATDRRQRVIVKVHYHAHAGIGGAGLRAHGRYLAREAAVHAPSSPEHTPQHEDAGQTTGPFYDKHDTEIDAAARLAHWARADRRHFRIILSAESGARMGDMTSFVREVMRRAEAALGKPLEWVAVNHWDTDNPHTHIVLRGVSDHVDLRLPRHFVSHGLRNIARDVATQELGARTRSDAARALDAETRVHRPTRFDRTIATVARPGGEVRLDALREAGFGQAYSNALVSRMQELTRLGLAERLTRSRWRLSAGWFDRLASMEAHLDIAKNRVRERRMGRAPGLGRSQ